jgi:hypothetical protein
MGTLLKNLQLAAQTDHALPPAEDRQRAQSLRLCKGPPFRSINRFSPINRLAGVQHASWRQSANHKALMGQNSGGAQDGARSLDKSNLRLSIIHWLRNRLRFTASDSDVSQWSIL